MLVSQAVLSVCLLMLGSASSGACAMQGDCETPEFMSRADIRGLGLAEIEGQRIDVSVYGFAAYPDACVSDETIFEAASLTKPVVAYIVMRLVDQGRLGLDDSLVELLPTLPFPKEDERSARVTVRMALSHSTGLDGPDNVTLSFINDPGETFRYYPAGYRLVQRIVEDIEGESLEAIAKREVFDPLGMRSSSFIFREDLLDRIAIRHRMLGDAFKRVRDPGVPANAAASLVTTPGDYARFLRAMLMGTGLSSEARSAMLAPQIVVPETNGDVAWGIGWGLEPARGTFFHWGDDGAAKCFTIGVTDADRAIVYFANSYYGMAIAGEIAERLLPGESPAVEWLSYGSWDSPKRLVRIDCLRAFVEGDAELGMATFLRYETEYPELDMENAAAFLTWVLDGRSKHEGRARLIDWQLERNPEDVGLLLEQARSFRAYGDDAGAVDSLLRAVQLSEGENLELLGNQIRWIMDELLADAPSRGRAPMDADALTGTFGERQVRFESGDLVYQRIGSTRFKLIWMHGTTYALEGVDDFRIRFEVERGEASRIIGLYEGGRTDESPRSLATE